MMIPNLRPMEIVLILAVVLLLFGAKKLPALAKSVGESLKILKKEVNEDAPPPTPAPMPAPALAPAPTAVGPEPVLAESVAETPAPAPEPRGA